MLAVALALAYAVTNGLHDASNAIAPLVETRAARPLQAAMLAQLAFGRGSNDAQKSVGVIAALLVADGRAASLQTQTWAAVACALALITGTMLGGWRVVRTIGRGIVHLHPLDGVAAPGASAAVIVGASALGAPVSTTQVVASSVVGVGVGRPPAGAPRRRREARPAPGAADRVRHPARARGPVRALARDRPADRPGQGHRARVRGHGLPARRAAGRGGDPDRRRRPLDAAVATLAPGVSGRPRPPIAPSRRRAGSNASTVRRWAICCTSTTCAR